MAQDHSVRNPSNPHDHIHRYLLHSLTVKNWPQVTERLLEAEDKKLKVLKAEIEASKHSDAATSSTEKVHIPNPKLQAIKPGEISLGMKLGKHSCIN